MQLYNISIFHYHNMNFLFVEVQLIHYEYINKIYLLNSNANIHKKRNTQLYLVELFFILLLFFISFFCVFMERVKESEWE